MKVLRQGSQGPMVEFLQNLLIRLRFYSGNIDGIFGPKTKKSVIQMQRNFGLNPDGIVGTKTWNALKPYYSGALGFIIPTNISYSYEILKINLNTLKELYPFIEISTMGKSVLGNDLPVIKIGTGQNEVFYSASFHAKV